MQEKETRWKKHKEIIQKAKRKHYLKNREKIIERQKRYISEKRIRSTKWFKKGYLFQFDNGVHFLKDINEGDNGKRAFFKKLA